MTLRVIVAGAGLGGLTLAHGLHRASVDVMVYERDQGPAVRAQGARFHIDDRGIRALRACLPPAQFELFHATLGGSSDKILVVGDVDGRLEILGSNSFTGAEGRPDQVRSGRPASRRLLRQILLHGLEGHVEFGKEVVRHERLHQGVRVYFADGTRAEADLLVAAEGVGSAVRRQYLPHAEVVDTGVRWLGGKTPITPGLRQTGLLALLGSSFTITDLGEVGMVLAAMRFSEPPVQAAARLVPGLDPGDIDDFLMWALIPPREMLGDAALASHTVSGERLWRQARPLVEEAHPSLRLVVEQAWPEQTYYLPLAASIPVAAWQPGPVTLLGDAIHAMPPNRGSGANTALQDAERLCARLIDVDRGERDLLEAVAAYEKDMRRDGFEAVNASMEALSGFLKD
ncbi:FAD-dependent oxidoreductase [Nonomuraea longispora]|uniref:FAD-dependent oxidoreductase n=1 Tax=Nonomuraea longispora TaxID=1848320 RepID=UPI001C6FE971|nr:NAD(P)/FAD-dependent oxidoreductase [Nonomuraea longispora]